MNLDVSELKQIALAYRSRSIFAIDQVCGSMIAAGYALVARDIPRIGLP